jgi:putative ABC transport system permease protein
LTILSIFVGITTIFIFISFGWGLYDYVGDLAEEAGVDKFFVQVRGMSAPGLDNTFTLDETDLRVVDRANGVAEAQGLYFYPGEVVRDDERIFVFAVGHATDPAAIRLIEQAFTVEVEEGRQLRNNDRGKVVLGHNYMEPDEIFSKPYEVGSKITINDERFEVVGFYESLGNPQDDSNIYMPEDDIKPFFKESEPSYAMIVGRVQNADVIDATLDRVEKDLRRHRGQDEGEEDFYVQSYQDLIDQFGTVLNIVIGFIIMIAFISVVVSAINTTNTMVTSVLERIQEIGTMKAIGATNATIRNIFLFESAILGGVAGILGCVAGWALSFFGAFLLDSLGWGFLSPHFSWILFAGCIGFAVIVGALSGMIPAIQASKQNPVDALRYE